MKSHMSIQGAKEGNLKNISLEVPRDKLVVFTGVSGSGKSTLAHDVIFQECQRQYLEAIGLQGIPKPKLDAMRHVSPAVRISQAESNKNPRSTLGTVTNIYTDLRMVYEKLSVRACPHCESMISAADCKEVTEKVDGDFHVYMDCCHCNGRMVKLTRTHFSYNTREGACPTCEGLGHVWSVVKERCVDASLSLEDGAVRYWSGPYKEYQIESLHRALRYYQLAVEADTPVERWSPIAQSILYHGVEHDEVKRHFPEFAAPKTVAAGKFEGVLTTLWRRMAEKEGEGKAASEYFESIVCHDCKGERLGVLSRNARVEQTRLPELSEWSLEELLAWILNMESALSSAHRCHVEVYIQDLKTKIQRILNVGVGYLSLNRQTITLSGGEQQRVKLAAALDSDLTGILYIMDEPTVGLHPQDTAGMIKVLQRLRDLGNTVIVIEHDPDVMEAADWIVDLGPRAGKHGGEIVASGTLEELKANERSLTGTYLQKPSVELRQPRQGSGEVIAVRKAIAHNLNQVDVDFPLGCLTAVTGVSGSGKSTLVFDVLARAAESGYAQGQGLVSGLASFDQIISIEQAAITRMKRSNVATYADFYGDIRSLFAKLEMSQEKGLTAKHFSFNTSGGRCENCEGLGDVTSSMLFFENVQVTCPVCQGNQFNEEVLSVKYRGYSIKDILKLSVEEAGTLFRDHTKLMKALELLQEVGLGYLELGQTLTTLSGGEGQRLKLAKELMKLKGRQTLYVMDEPTTGLHPVDVEHFLKLLHRIVDAGSTVIVVEHNHQVIMEADWVIDLGPEGGTKGGHIVFAGTPLQMIERGTSVTADSLRSSRDRSMV